MDLLALPSNLLRQIANSYFSQRLYSEALNIMNVLIEREESPFPRDYVWRGSCYSWLSQIQASIDDFTVAISLTPEDESLYAFRAAQYSRLNSNDDTNFVLSRADYSEAIRLKPEHGPWYVSRASMSLRLGDYEKAMQDYNRSIELSPDVSECFTGRALLYALLGRKDLALRDFQSALELDGSAKDKYALADNGVASFIWADYETAREKCTQLAKLCLAQGDEQSRSIALWRRSFAYCHLEQYDRARADLKESYAIEPAFLNFVSMLQTVPHLGVEFDMFLSVLGPSPETKGLRELIPMIDSRRSRVEFVLEHWCCWEMSDSDSFDDDEDLDLILRRRIGVRVWGNVDGLEVVFRWVLM